MGKREFLIGSAFLSGFLLYYYRDTIRTIDRESLRKKILNFTEQEKIAILKKLYKISLYFNRQDRAIYFLRKIVETDRFNEQYLDELFNLEQQMKYYENALYTITVLSHINKKYLPVKKRIFKVILNKDLFSSPLFPHHHHIEQILNTFPDIQLSMEDIESIYNSEEEDDRTVFVKGLVEHILCNNRRANEILKDSTFHYSIILYAYINNQSIPEYILMAHKEDFSTNLYNIIINKSDNRVIEECIKKYTGHKNLYLLYILKIHNILNSKKISEALTEIDQITYKNLNIYKFLLNYLIHNNQTNYIGRYVKYIEEDALYYNLYMGIYKNEEEYFVKAIENSDGFFEPYFRYGTFLMNRGDKRFMKIYDMAQQYASTYEELRMVRQVLLSLDVYKKLYEEYPEFEE